MNNTWWKWGNVEKLKHVNDFPKLIELIEKDWNVKISENNIPDFKYDFPELSDAEKSKIQNTFSFLTKAQISFKLEDRLYYGLGKSYYDVLKVYNKDKIGLPAVIISPANHDEVVKILKAASDNKYNIIPAGGSSNVVGALHIEEKEKRISILLNLRNMNNLLQINKEQYTATFQAGIFGPKLEELLQRKGFTLGHFPQSFEYSSLGGWVVTRSAGQNSTYYGKIEDLVESIKVATPVGSLKTPEFTHDAEGINPLPIFVGSEGTLGVVTEVTVKIRKYTNRYRWICALAPDFKAGSEILKNIIQSDIKPSVVRLSDAPETFFFTKLAHKEGDNSILKQVKDKIQSYVLEYKNLSNPCLMMLRVEEPFTTKASDIVFIKNQITSHKGMIIPDKYGYEWEKTRFDTPYLRDSMVEHGIFIDTMETYVPWNKVQDMHTNMEKVLRKSDYFGREKGFILSHISHIYPQGACMYFILITYQQKGKELEQWKNIKKLVTDTFIENGGSVSHHHSVGADHQEWYLKKADPLALKIFQNIKQTLDPNHIMNPGKLYDVQP